MKKAKPVPKRKRPKSVFKKMWETRRAKKALALEPKYDPKAPLVIDREAFLKDLAAEMPAAQQDNSPDTSSLCFSVDAISRTLELSRDEQLLAFMGDMSAIRSMRPHNDHHPVFLSRPQAEAIEQFLSDHGYSAWGKGSGRFASISTDPKAA